MSKNKQRKTVKEICYAALGAAVLTVCSWICLPLGGIPLTLQTFGLCLICATLGGKVGTLATAAYLALGFIGVPVFAGVTGGAGKLFSPTGGYLLGFLIAAPLIGFTTERKKGWSALALGMSVGILFSYAFGTAWFVALCFQSGERVGLWTALLTCVFPYLPFEILKIGFAAPLSARLRKTIK